MLIQIGFVVFFFIYSHLSPNVDGVMGRVIEKQETLKNNLEHHVLVETDKHTYIIEVSKDEYQKIEVNEWIQIVPTKGRTQLYRNANLGSKESSNALIKINLGK